MRKIISTLCLLLATLCVGAASPLRGLRIETSGQPVLIYVDGVQVCTASTHCFVANLPGGNYLVEAFSALPGRRGEQGGRPGDLLYSERVRFSGRGVLDIVIAGRPGHSDHGFDHPSGDRSRDGYYPDVMNQPNFDRFFHAVKEATFDSERIKLIETALVTSNFTSEQCRLLAGLYPFDKDKMKVMKLMYPRIVDKSNFVFLFEILTFSSSKNEMSEFVKQYRAR